MYNYTYIYAYILRCGIFLVATLIKMLLQFKLLPRPRYCIDSVKNS